MTAIGYALAVALGMLFGMIIMAKAAANVMEENEYEKNTDIV